MKDWLSVQIGLSTQEFYELLEETIARLVAVVQAPSGHPPDFVEMARGALMILSRGPHRIPRDKKMAYVDDMVHLLVAREGLFPQEVSHQMFDVLVVGIPEPPRYAIADLSTHLCRIAEEVPDTDLLRDVARERDQIWWNHPARQALANRAAGFAIFLVVCAAIHLGDGQLGRRLLMDPTTAAQVTLLTILFSIMLNMLLGVFLAPAPTSPYGPPIEEMGQEGRSLWRLLVEEIMERLTLPFTAHLFVALFAVAVAWGAAIGFLWEGNATVNSALRYPRAAFYSIWSFTHAMGQTRDAIKSYNPFEVKQL